MRKDKTPEVGGGMPVIKYWAEKTISPDGKKIWEKLFHKSACLSCAWGTGGQKGGFVNEDGEILQRCAKSVEAIASELQPATYFEQNYTLSQLQELNSQEANNLGRLSHPLILRAGSSRYERISWDKVYQIAETAFSKSAQRIASYSSGRSSNEAAFLLQLMMRSLGSNNLKHAETTPWEMITSTCGISQNEIAIAARMIGTSVGVVFAWAMGVTQQENGVDNIFSIANTALLTGNAGKPGAGTMPIRGHSNVQGFGSMGVTIHLKKEIQQALEKLLQRPLSRIPGYDTRALITAAEAGKVDTLICLGGNLYAANPYLNQAKRALGQIDTIFYVATKPNLGHFHGLAKQNTIILPVFTRFENPHKITTESGNNFVRLNDVGTTHLKDGDLISEVELIVEIAHRILGDNPVNWRKLQDTKYVRELIAKTIPGYEKIGKIDITEEEFTISGRVFERPKFATPTGKAKMFVTALPKLDLLSKSDFGVAESTPGIILILGTVRSYSQHNTVVYKPGDYYRGMPHRNCILMNREDAEKAGFSEHQRVTVQGDAGKLENVEIIFGDTRKGAAMMFYPEVNVIFKAKIDMRSGTPAYKRVPVFVFA